MSTGRPLTSLRVGIVGCGRIAGNHARALSRLPDVTVVGCADPQPGRAAGFAREHDIPLAAEDLEGLIREGVDAVTVCTPHPVHEPIVLHAAEAGLHVLCEKPIAVDLAAADRMIEATQRAGVRFGALFQRRFWPAAQRIRDAIDDGRLGRPVLGEVSVLLHRPEAYYAADPWRGRWDTDGGGVLMTQAIHQIDLLQWFLGRPTQVSGHIRTHVHGDHIEVEDTASAVVAFESGATATITATTATNHNLGNRVTIMGETGAIASVLEFPEGREGVNEIWTVPGETSFRAAYDATAPRTPTVDDVNAALVDFHAQQIQDFAEAVLDDRDPIITGREARTSLAIVTGIYESSRTGRTTVLHPETDGTRA